MLVREEQRAPRLRLKEQVMSKISSPLTYATVIAALLAPMPVLIAAPAADEARAFDRASELIGKNVQNRSGESLGEINDLAIDLHHGKVPFAVLSFGGVLGVGDKLFA